MKTLTISADGTATVTDQPITLPFLQQEVGGFIEAVYPTEHLTLYVNEEGLYRELPNYDLTLLVTGLRGLAGYNAILHGAGVFCGPVDDNGEETGLTDEQVAELLAMLREVRNMLSPEVSE